MTAKSRPRWLVGDFSERSTFSRKRYGGRFSVRSRWICHQRTPFLPCDAERLVERLGDRIILARESADEQLMVGDGPTAGLDLVEDLVDVLADVLAGREVAGVAVERGLRLRAGSHWFAQTTCQPDRSSPSRNPPTPANSSTTRGRVFWTVMTGS